MAIIQAVKDGKLVDTRCRGHFRINQKDQKRG